MRLDFTQLHANISGTMGTLGTTRINEQIRVPECENFLGTGGDAQEERSEQSPRSPAGPLQWGHEKASIRRPISSVPAVPQKKTIQAIETGSVDELLIRLEPFRFDLVAADIAAGAPAAEIDRTNNLCWEIMRADKLPFNQAMAIAASVVVTCDPTPVEFNYQDVRQLWLELKGDENFAKIIRR